jgi:hypothetical protein
VQAAQASVLSARWFTELSEVKGKAKGYSKKSSACLTSPLAEEPCSQRQETEVQTFSGARIEDQYLVWSS